MLSVVKKTGNPRVYAQYAHKTRTAMIRNSSARIRSVLNVCLMDKNVQTIENVVDVDQQGVHVIPVNVYLKML